MRDDMVVSEAERAAGIGQGSRVLESHGAEEDTAEDDDDLHERDKEHSLLIVRLDPCLCYKSLNISICLPLDSAFAVRHSPGSASRSWPSRVKEQQHRQIPWLLQREWQRVWEARWCG